MTNPRFNVGERVVADHQWSTGSSYPNGKYECVVVQVWRDDTTGVWWYSLDFIGIGSSISRPDAQLVPMSKEMMASLEMIACSHCAGSGRVRRR
jgi:hypothetical protein